MQHPIPSHPCCSMPCRMEEYCTGKRVACVCRWCCCHVPQVTGLQITYLLAACLQIAYLATIIKGHTTPTFVAYLAAYLAAMLACAATRTPGRREAQACLLRLASFFPPFWGTHALRGLAAPLPAGGGGIVLLSLRLTARVLYATGTLPNLGLAFGRRVRLWLQLLVQAAVVAATLPRTDQLCRTPGLTDPGAERLLGAAYHGLRWPMQLMVMPLPGLLLGQHTAHGRCRWVCWPATSGGCAGGCRPPLCGVRAVPHSACEPDSTALVHSVRHMHPRVLPGLHTACEPDSTAQVHAARHMHPHTGTAVAFAAWATAPLLQVCAGHGGADPGLLAARPGLGGPGGQGVPAVEAGAPACRATGRGRAGWRPPPLGPAAAAVGVP